FALTHLRRSIDRLPKRVVGTAGSLERRHVHATLRDQVRDLLQKRLRGDETWDQARELTDELVAAWYVEQAPPSRMPNTAKFAAVGATGVVGGMAAAAARDPPLRGAAAKLKAPLLSFADKLLKLLSAPPSTTSPPPPSPSPPASPPQDPAATTPPPSPVGLGLGLGWRPSYSR